MQRRWLTGSRQEKSVAKNLIARFVRETEGQDLIEYALLAALIGLVTVAAMKALQLSISMEFNNIGTAADRRVITQRSFSTLSFRISR